MVAAVAPLANQLSILPLPSGDGAKVGAHSLHPRDGTSST
ncbi:hypothetical protein HMPREF1556_00174 [Porphyromonas sp. oral taxon 278 str. W7784]|nr:hypothetical protein HMPREF1556_00174 [Porphyromonas sp. oral taxon 278 str. W7784]